MNAKLSNYIQNIQRQAQKAGGLVVSVGKAMYKVTMVALEAAKKYVNEQLIPWLKVKVTPIWESAKKTALKILLDETGIDTNKEFSLKFDTSKFTQEKILAGLKKVTLATLEDSAIEFGKGLLKNTPFLATTIISGVVANSPICVGAVSVTIATAGAGSPAIAACAMGVITYVTPPIYLQLSRLALQVALEQVPKVLGRLVEEFCPITGNGAKLICKGFTYAAEYDSDKAMGQIGGMFKRRALKGKRRRAQQVSSKRRRLSVLTASHD